jgi:hypothetical protein
MVDMPDVDFEGALDWIASRRGLLEWVLWRGKFVFAVKHEFGRWKGVGKGNNRRSSLSGRPSKVKIVADMDLTGFLDGCAKNGEGIRAICRRLERFLGNALKLPESNIPGKSIIGTAQPITISGGTTRRVIGRLVMKRLLKRLDNGLYVRGTPEPTVIQTEQFPAPEPSGTVLEKVEPESAAALQAGEIVPPPVRDVNAAFNAAFAPGVPDAAPGVVPEPAPGPTCPTCKVRLGTDLTCPSCGVGFVVQNGRLSLALAEPTKVPYGTI